MDDPIAGASAPAADAARRRIRVDLDRVFYCGLLGQPTVRRIGAITLYVAPSAPLRYTLHDDDWSVADCVVVQPYVPHRLASDGRFVCSYLVEPETVEPGALPDFMRSGEGGAAHAPDFIRRTRVMARGARLADADLDIALLGQRLPARQLDPRIAQVVGLLQAHPDPEVDASAYAQRVHLSPSRLLHLFKQETGYPYRTLRAWKRARSLLTLVHRHWNLTQLAQEIGYPDATHFSHSIRQIYGLTPKNILQGSRRIEVVSARSTPACAAP